MSEVCSNVSTEPHLQPLTDEILQFRTANSDSNARLDIATNGFLVGKFEFFLLESLTLIHHLIIPLNLLIAAMKSKEASE